MSKVGFVGLGIMGRPMAGHLRAAGDGQSCKVANQIIVALTIEAVGEALLFASKMGADPAKARQMGLSLPNTATAQQLVNACAARGGKAWDHSAMVRALELLANHEIGAGRS